jgi:hypothetical protein
VWIIGTTASTVLHASLFEPAIERVDPGERTAHA